VHAQVHDKLADFWATDQIEQLGQEEMEPDGRLPGSAADFSFKSPAVPGLP
jgi:hypothetical protein